jgi:protein-arginine kinase activator protein McsA
MDKTIRHFPKHNPPSAGSKKWCSDCATEHSRSYRQKYRSKPEVQEAQWAKNLKRTYGMTKENYFQMLKEQGDACAICVGFRNLKSKRRLAVDHCHKTGKIRGLLCDYCNRGIGVFEDRPKLIEVAAAYLMRRSQ